MSTESSLTLNTSSLLGGQASYGGALYLQGCILYLHLYLFSVQHFHKRLQDSEQYGFNKWRCNLHHFLQSDADSQHTIQLQLSQDIRYAHPRHKWSAVFHYSELLLQTTAFLLYYQRE